MTDLASRSDAERMDRHYRVQRHIYDATRTHYLIGRSHLLRGLEPRGGQSVLEIGCGTAWNLVRAARLYPDARFFGLDVSSAMLATARRSLERRGLADRVILRQGDATYFDAAGLFSLDAFDRVFISYALSMIPGWIAALEHAASLLAPGGSLHIVDFGQCGDLPRVFKATLLAFLRHYSVVPRPDLEQRCRDAADRFRLDLRFERLHHGYTDYAVLSRSGAVEPIGRHDRSARTGSAIAPG
jgi:S-adenosylmethionine-diacylgycerolhomoserine-N-methlytransferase